MTINSSYHMTSTKETLLEHAYINKYTDIDLKSQIHAYKFNIDVHNSEYIYAKKILVQKTLDICLAAYISRKKGLLIYTSPPSTMYIRKEKKVDSMFELLRSATTILFELVQKIPENNIVLASIFSTSHIYIQKKRAQHIDGNRKSRIDNLHTRYTISHIHTLYMYYCMYIRKITHYSYLIVDDVSATGATLTACKDTLLKHMSLIHRKNPHITYEVQIFSIVH